MIRILALLLLCLVGCGRTVTAPEATFENITKYCWPSDSGVTNGRAWTSYTCSRIFRPTP